MSDDGGRAFGFEGTWKDYAPIAFTNLLLIIVTLGFYRFWATTRTRQYLWSHTRFIDETLEWTGTGMELFIGFLLVLLFFFVPIFALQFVTQALLINGAAAAAGLVFLLMFGAIFYLSGVALFRMLRYRLSRTYWHGIRGGSDEQGFGYAVSHLWKTGVGSAVLGLMVPWAMTQLWNQRWSAMSFGPHRFTASADWRPLMLRYLLYYLVPIVLVVGGFAVAVMAGPEAAGTSPGEIRQTLVIAALIGYVVFFVLLGLIALIFYAAYFREAVSNLSLADLDFRFEARTADWFKLMLGNIALVVATLGIGVIFLGYRNWSFFIRHLNAFGTLDLDSFTQSETRTPRQGEGLLDAFDVGAF